MSYCVYCVWYIVYATWQGIEVQYCIVRLACNIVFEFPCLDWSGFSFSREFLGTPTLFDAVKFKVTFSEAKPLILNAHPFLSRSLMKTRHSSWPTVRPRWQRARLADAPGYRSYGQHHPVGLAVLYLSEFLLLRLFITETFSKVKKNKTQLLLASKQV